MQESNAMSCQNCEAVLQGNYCHQCGQKKISPHDYALGHFIEHAIHDITHFDSKIFRSLLPLLFKPGLLTSEYLAGRQARFIKPITLFILLNLFFFVVGYRLGLLNWNMHGVTKGGPHSALAERLVEKKILAAGLSREEFALHFNAALAHQQRNMFFLIIPLFAVALKIVYWRVRRYYVEHLIYSIHFHSFLLIFLVVGLLAFIYFLGVLDLVLGTKLGPYFGRDPGILYPIVIGMIWHLVFSLKRVYRQSWLATGVKTIVLLGSELVIIQFIYRPLLFFLTFYIS